MAEVLKINDYRHGRRATFFNRRELNQLLSLYSRRVASGEWRDYAIDQHAGMAVFSVFRSSREGAVYTIAKQVTGAGQPPEFLVLGGRERLAHSSDLKDALAVFDRRPRPAL